MNDENLQTAQMQALIDRGRAGEPGAFDELIRRTSHRLTRIAHQMLHGFTQVKSQVETDDVLQAALMRLLRALKTIRPDSMRGFYSLAAGQIRWELLDLARHYRCRVCPRIRLDSHWQDPEAYPPLELAAPSPSQTELNQWCAFHEAVAHLSPAQREVLSLTFYHGWTQERIAELLQVSARQVRRYLHSAYQTLHESISREDL